MRTHPPSIHLTKITKSFICSLNKSTILNSFQSLFRKVYTHTYIYIYYIYTRGLSRSNSYPGEDGGERGEIRSTGRYLEDADRMRAAFLDETRAHASASRSRIGEIHWPVDISIINRWHDSTSEFTSLWIIRPAVISTMKRDGDDWAAT